MSLSTDTQSPWVGKINRVVCGPCAADWTRLIGGKSVDAARSRTASGGVQEPSDAHSRPLFLLPFPSPTTSPNDRIHQRQLPHSIHHLHQLPKTTSISRNGTKGSTKGNLARLWHVGASQSHSNLSRRPHPPAARHQLARLLLLRRRRPARRLPPHLATRRSAPRPERRPTLRTSTRVCFLTSIHLAHPDSKSHFDFKSIMSHLNLSFCPFTDASSLSPQAGTP